MYVVWRKSALDSLLKLDKWRESVGLNSIKDHLMITVERYFDNQDFSIYIPGRKVLTRHMPVDLRMVLLAIGKSDPYKVFFRQSGNKIEIFLIRHPNQKPM